MARARRFAPSGVRGPKRLTQWVGPADQGYIALPSAAGSVLIANLPFEEPTTIVRTRGVVSVRITAYGLDVDVHGAFGIGIVSAEALAVGVTAMPTPLRDADWGGWFVWRSFAFHWEFQSAAGERMASYEMEIDSKAMRKITPNEALVVVAESGSSQIIQLYDGTRHLLKLS